jgi:hypothetical protein
MFQDVVFEIILQSWRWKAKTEANQKPSRWYMCILESGTEALVHDAYAVRPTSHNV